MRLRALAKINLGLDVVGKRADGYHEVRMIMQTIQMYDVLEMKKKKIKFIHSSQIIWKPISFNAQNKPKISLHW